MPQFTCTTYLNTNRYLRPTLKTLDEFTKQDWINLCTFTFTLSYARELTTQEQRFIDFLSQWSGNIAEFTACFDTLSNYYNRPEVKPEERFTLTQFCYQLYDWYSADCTSGFCLLSLTSFCNDLIKSEQKKQARLAEYRKQQAEARLRRLTWQEQADIRAEQARRLARAKLKPLSKKALLEIALMESINLDELDL